MNIRKMQKDDVDQMTAIEAISFSQPWSKKLFEEAINHENLLFLVAEIDGIIAGYCGLYMVLDEGNVINVAVEENFRNQHIAMNLLVKLLDEGSKRGIKAFTLEVRQHNVLAIHLYEKLGFQSVGIRKNFYEKPIENAVIMWKR